MNCHVRCAGPELRSHVSVAPNGQNTAQPKAHNNAGASVRQAASVTSRHSANGWSAVAELAEVGEEHHRQTAESSSCALRQRALAHRAMLSATAASTPATPGNSSRNRANQEQTEIGAGAVQDHDDEDPGGLEDLEAPPVETRYQVQVASAARAVPWRLTSDTPIVTMRHHDQQRRTVHDQQDRDHQHHGQPLGVADALGRGAQHVAADGRGTRRSRIQDRSFDGSVNWSRSCCTSASTRPRTRMLSVAMNSFESLEHA